MCRCGVMAGPKSRGIEGNAICSYLVCHSFLPRHAYEGDIIQHLNEICACRVDDTSPIHLEEHTSNDYMHASFTYACDNRLDRGLLQQAARKKWNREQKSRITAREVLEFSLRFQQYTISDERDVSLSVSRSARRCSGAAEEKRARPSPSPNIRVAT